MTLEIVTEQGLGVDEAGFESLMDEQRTRARQGSRGSRATSEIRERAAALSGSAGFSTEFVGYETTDATTTIGAVRSDGDGELLIKLRESPFYATGGGQVADAGVLECEGGGCRARVTDVIRLGTDQIVALAPEHGAFEPGERVSAPPSTAGSARDRVQPHRHPPAARGAAPPPRRPCPPGGLLRRARQAAVRLHPHGALPAAQLRSIEDDVNAWILESHAVRALQTTLDEARALGAMALFNEKYGEIVRMVEVGDGSFSRELCGGTHVRSTSEIGLFRLLNETSSAANVRRIEAITGPEAVGFMRDHDRELQQAAGVLRVPPERVADSVRALREQVRELERAAKAGGNGVGRCGRRRRS